MTKSGTNSVHGSAVEFVRNDAFDAHNYFDDPTKAVPTLDQHQFGVNIGGPIKKGRTFFFFSYEGQRIHRLGMNDTLYGRVTTYRVHDTQPFGTTSLNEALIPGFGRTVTTDSENLAPRTHAHVCIALAQ